jgi:hypothetical protein
MAQFADELRYLIDRAAIQDVIARYFQGIDRCDPERVRSCFTDDVQAHYDERPPTHGIEELMAGFRTFRRRQEGTMKITTHFMGNLNIGLIQGDVAETETNAIAFLVDPADQVAMRSLRYIGRAMAGGSATVYTRWTGAASCRRISPAHGRSESRRCRSGRMRDEG